MTERIVIVGGGVIGSSIAYFLKASDPAVQVSVIERDPSYAALARKRIAEIVPLAAEDVMPKLAKRAEPRIPFGVLIEAGLLRPGTVLSDLSGRLHARVRADGSLSAANSRGEHRGSIHQVGAAVQGAPACNGWTFWHVEVEGARRPIDHLRQQVRAGL